jgi:hypothetical protein
LELAKAFYACLATATTAFFIANDKGSSNVKDTDRSDDEYRQKKEKKRKAIKAGRFTPTIACDRVL